MKQNPVAKDAGNVFISFCWHKFIIVLTGLPIFITRATPMAAASKALSSGGSQRRHIHNKRQLVFIQGQQRTVWNGSTAKEGKAETEGCNGEDNGREMVNFKRRDLSMKLKYYHVASVSHNHFFQKNTVYLPSWLFTLPHIQNLDLKISRKKTVYLTIGILLFCTLKICTFW